jgi:hypothetical protein
MKTSIIVITVLSFFAMIVSCDQFNPFNAGGVEPGFTGTRILFYTEELIIYKVNVDGTGKTTVFDRSGAPAGIAHLRVNRNNGKIYWLENDRVYCGNMDGSGTPSPVLETGGAGGIGNYTLDIKNDRLFFQSNNEIRYTSIANPAFPGTTVQGGHYNVMKMEYAPSGTLFWVEMIGTPEIFSYDGSVVQTFLKDNNVEPMFYLKAENMHGILYFSYYTSGNSHLTGYNISTGTPAGISTYISGISIHDICFDSVNGYMYLTSVAKIIRTDLGGQNPTDILTTANIFGFGNVDIYIP